MAINLRKLSKLKNIGKGTGAIRARAASQRKALEGRAVVKKAKPGSKIPTFTQSPSKARVQQNIEARTRTDLGVAAAQKARVKGTQGSVSPSRSIGKNTTSNQLKQSTGRAKTEIRATGAAKARAAGGTSSSRLKGRSAGKNPSTPNFTLPEPIRANKRIPKLTKRARRR